MKIRSDIKPSVFRVFVAVHVAYALNGRAVTVRDVVDMVHANSNSYVHHCLKLLRDMGWIGFEAFSGGTIRPLRRLELIEG